MANLDVSSFPSSVPTQLLQPQELLAKARQLAEKLRTHDDIATNLLVTGRSLEKRQSAVKELHSLLSQHSDIPFCGVTRASVVKDTHHEHRILQGLRQENEELTQAVQENGDAIQYIMRKYHQHSQKLCDLQKQDAAGPRLLEKLLTVMVKENAEDLEGMIGLTQQVVQMEDKAAVKRSASFRSITKENMALRRALNIANRDFSARFSDAGSN